MYVFHSLARAFCITMARFDDSVGYLKVHVTHLEWCPSIGYTNSSLLEFSQLNI